MRTRPLTVGLWLAAAAAWLCTVPGAAGQPPTPSSSPANAARDLEHILRVYPGSFDPAASARLLAIAKELEALGDGSSLPEGDWAREWAGVYGAPSGFSSETFAIAPKAGFIWYQAGCTGITDFVHGELLNADAGGARVKIAGSCRSQQEVLEERVYFVRLGERHLAIPDSRIGDFLNQYNAVCGRVTLPVPEIDWPRIPVRAGDHAKAATGPLKLPIELGQFVLTAPIEARITKVQVESTNDGRALGTVTLDAGHVNGVYPKLPFRVRCANRVETLTVQTVDLKTCTARFDFGATAMSNATPPGVGAGASTLEAKLDGR
jgi:hypothetical protein